MNRLTKEQIINATTSQLILERTAGKQMANKMIAELVEYKELEEKFGVDLPTLIRLFSGYNPLYVNCIDYDKYSGEKYESIGPSWLYDRHIDIDRKEITFFNPEGEDMIYPLSDYGKNFSFDKEDLERK